MPGCWGREGARAGEVGNGRHSSELVSNFKRVEVVHAAYPSRSSPTGLPRLKHHHAQPIAGLADGVLVIEKVMGDTGTCHPTTDDNDICLLREVSRRTVGRE